MSKLQMCVFFSELLADITDGDRSGSGTVIVLLNKMKGWICDDGWNQPASQVLCRSVGYRFVSCW